MLRSVAEYKRPKCHKAPAGRLPAEIWTLCLNAEESLETGQALDGKEQVKTSEKFLKKPINTYL